MCKINLFQVENGRATFSVGQEFSVSLTVMGDAPNLPWRLLDIAILIQDSETGGKVIVYHFYHIFLFNMFLNTIGHNLYFCYRRKAFSTHFSTELVTWSCSGEASSSWLKWCSHCSAILLSLLIFRITIYTNFKIVS